MNQHASALGKLAHAGDRDAIHAMARRMRAEQGLPPSPVFEPPVLELTRAQIVGRAPTTKESDHVQGR